MRGIRGISTAVVVLMILAGGVGGAAAAPEGQMTWGIHVSLAPTWFDPGRDHGDRDAVHGDVRAARRDGEAAAGQPAGAQPGRVVDASRPTGARTSSSCARASDSTTAIRSPPRTSSSRSSATGAPRARRSRSGWRRSRSPGPTRVRFRLKEPWPDFLTFYSSATGAGWIVPKKYVEKVGDEGFKKLPIGAGPYRFVSFTPGVELVLEAVDQYWRKTPAGEAAGLQDDSGPVHAIRRAQARRDRRQLLDDGVARRGAPANAGPHAQARRSRTIRTGSTSSTSGTRSPRGTTAGSGSPRTTRSTGRRSTRPRRSDSRE